MDGTGAIPAPVAGDYDADDDGLIEVRTLAQLGVIGYDPDGNGVSNPLYVSAYASAFPGALPNMGCPAAGCAGYELTANLDFDTNGNGKADEGDTYWNNGQGWYPIGSGAVAPDGSSWEFNAMFDGGGHTISNLFVCCGFSEIGLFGLTGKDSIIQNVRLESVNGTVGHISGGLIGINNGTVRGVAVGGRLVGDSVQHVGCLVGANGGTITGSSASCDVSTNGIQVGGLVGSNSGTMDDGSVVGAISDSYATGDVSGKESVGGLAGYNIGTISHSHAIGDVVCKSSCGSLVGKNEGAIINSRGIGAVTDNDG